MEPRPSLVFVLKNLKKVYSTVSKNLKKVYRSSCKKLSNASGATQQELGSRGVFLSLSITHVEIKTEIRYGASSRLLKHSNIIKQ